MKITKIEKQKRKRDYFSIYLDGRYSFSISDQNLLNHKLEEGQDISPDQLNDIIKEEGNYRALDSAFRLLGIRSRSRKELEERLTKKRFRKESIDQAIGRLSELGYMDDSRFALGWTQYRKSQGKGPELIRRELLKKGVNQDVINDVITRSKDEPEAEFERIRTIAEQKLKTMKGLPPQTIVRRLTGFLSRRGFNTDTIFTVLRQLKVKLENEEA